MSTFDLESTYLALDRDGGVTELPVGPDFWSKVQQSAAAGGAMVAVYPMKADWPHWEMHPRGDEVLVLLDGRLELILDEPGGERRVRFGPGQTVVIPAGVWHRALVPEPGRLLGITFGDGTEHRPA